jgi:adenylate kinase
MYIVLLGAPGSGKGTQAVFLAAELNVTHVASGDLFREHLHNRTPLGRRAEGFMSAGALVPDEITIAMLRERLERGTQREAFFSTDSPEPWSRQSRSAR